jgi:hypothetical protein
VKKLTLGPQLSLSDNDKREVCDLHGWVGRKRFQHERHDICVVPREDNAEDENSEDENEDKDETNEDPSVSSDGDEAPATEDEGSKVDTDGAETNELPRWSRAAARRQGIPPKKTLAVRRITQIELAAGRAELQELGADEPYERPKTRGDCARVPRPCPFVACKYSLYLDVSETGSIILNFPHLEPGAMPPHQSCALDLAERGAMTLEDIAVVTNLTRERIRQVELRALVRKARPAAVAMDLGPEDAAARGGRHRVGPGADLEETSVEGAMLIRLAPKATT